jgi:CheY-like chemotaxis protein
MMPSMSGQQIWQQLRGQPELSEVVVVAVSGDHGVSEKAQAMGLRSHLKKPFALDELLATVRRVLAAPAGEGGSACAT